MSAGALARVAPVFDRAPFIRLMGYRLVDAGDGWVETELEVAERHRQQHGYVHAGVLTAMADHTSGAAATTVIPEGRSILTAHLATHLLRPAAGGTLRCRAEVVKPGRTLIVTRADVFCDEAHVALFDGTMVSVEGDIA